MSDNASANVAPSRRVRLLVWDALDVAGRLADVLVDEPPGPTTIDLEAVYRWLAARCDHGEEPEACLFTAVRPGDEEAAAAEVTKARMQGFAVLAKIQPTLGRADLSGAMWSHIERALATASVAEVVVASHDGATFGPRLAGLAQRDVGVTVVGFRERAGYAAGRAGVAFVDLESLPGAFSTTLPRTNLYDLPSEGRLLPPLRRPDLRVPMAVVRTSSTSLAPTPSGPGTLSVVGSSGSGLTPPTPLPTRLPPAGPPTAPVAGTIASGPAPTIAGAPTAPLAAPGPVGAGPVGTGPFSGTAPTAAVGAGQAAVVAAPAAVPVTGTVIDLTAEERPAPEAADAPPPPPPPPPWSVPAAASAPDTGGAASDAPARPGRVMPPNT